MISMAYPNVLGTMQASFIIRGVCHCHGRKAPCRRQRGYRESQTCDKNGPEPIHNDMNYVTRSWEVKLLDRDVSGDAVHHRAAISSIEYKSAFGT
jgi:hypothetical protein